MFSLYALVCCRSGHLTHEEGDEDALPRSKTLNINFRIRGGIIAWCRPFMDGKQDTKLGSNGMNRPRQRKELQPT